jgi:hypothetical protein
MAAVELQEHYFIKTRLFDPGLRAGYNPLKKQLDGREMINPIHLHKRFVVTDRE